MTVRRYLCWCDGSPCSNTTSIPFAVCAECSGFGHRPLPIDGLVPEDIEFLNGELPIDTGIAHRQ